METSQLSAAQKFLLAVVYDGLRLAATDWPTATWVDARLDQVHGLDLDDVLAEMPPGLVTRDAGYGPHSAVRLSVAGAALVPAAREDCDYLVRLVSWLADREREHDPGSPTTPSPLQVDLSDAVAGAWNGVLPPEGGTNRILILAQTDGIFSAQRQNVGEGDEQEEQILLNVDRWIRAYRGLTDIADYVERRPEPPRPTRQWIPVGVTTLSQPYLGDLIQPTYMQFSGTNVAEPEVGGLYIFVLMPFTPDWSSNVWDVINVACERLREQYEDLSWERADGMTDAGRITDQIISAIERSDLVVADVTGSNPNVMFELGYAAALDRPIILMNQAVDESPFDIKDWRQIVYSLDKLAEARGELLRHLDANLHRVRERRAS